MKDILKYNYNINDVEISEFKNFGTFILNNKKYYLLEYFRSEEELKDIILIVNEMINKGLNYSRIILNNKNSYLTIVDERKYVLVEMGLDDSSELCVIDMLKYSNSLIVQNNKSILIRSNWGELWSKKVDYFEYQIRELGKDKKLVINSFSYFVGLAENAISYYNHTLKTLKPTILDKLCLQHRRIGYPNNFRNYFNPINYVIDYEQRDIASYLKSMFFKADYNEVLIELEAFLKNKRLSLFGYQIFYARLIYPSYYFDIYEQIMEDKLTEDALLPYISKVDEYELFLKDVYYSLSKYANIERIEWLLTKKES